MLIRCGLLLLFLSCVKTTENIDDDFGASDYNRRFSLWPSVLNAARLMRVRREDTKITPEGISEGDTHAGTLLSSSTTTQAPQQALNNDDTNNLPLKNQATNQGFNLSQNNASPGLNNGQTGLSDVKSDPNYGATNAKSGTNVTKSEPSGNDSGLSDAKSVTNNAKSGSNDDKSVTNNAKSASNDDKFGTSVVKQGANNDTTISPNLAISNTPVSPVVNATNNSTNAVKTAKDFDLNDPGVVKRGFIVFGGFALMAVAYYIFYRRKGKNNTSSNTHSLTDTNQFRYGVLQSEDKRDTELSRVPLTMESDEDEEDLEIFDLGQKKKSLSYVNLQTNDEDVVFSLNDHEDDDRGNLLLDIEDGPSDTLINWSGDGNNKSIL